jgi:hypothetical protein
MMLKVALSLPTTDGEKVTLIVQLPFGSNVAGTVPQLLVCVKSALFVPLIGNPETTSGALPVLVRVDILDGLVVATFWLAKFKLVEESVVAGTCTRTDTVLSALLVTPKSSRPLPVKSPTATEEGFLPVAAGEVVGKSPLPSPKRMVTLGLTNVLLATARSSLPSPLKSPIATEDGFEPVTGDEAVGVKLPPA